MYVSVCVSQCVCMCVCVCVCVCVCACVCVQRKDEGVWIHSSKVDWGIRDEKEVEGNKVSVLLPAFVRV